MSEHKLDIEGHGGTATDSRKITKHGDKKNLSNTSITLLMSSCPLQRMSMWLETGMGIIVNNQEVLD